MSPDPHNAGPAPSLEAEDGSLTHSETQIWLGQKLGGDAPLYNTPFTFRIRGSLDRDLFQRAFHQCVEHCDALRGTFHDGPRGPRRTLRPIPETGQLEWIDLSTSADPCAEAHALLAERATRPFDLATCLFDSALVKLGTDDHLWFLNQHHLMTDAWATSLLYRQLEQCYRDLRTGESTTPPPPHSTYRAHERSVREQPEPEAEAWWQARSGGAPPDLYGRGNPCGTTDSTRVEIDLGPRRSEQLRNASQEPGVRALTTDLSLFQILNTVVFALLRRATGESALTLGTPAHHRSSPVFRQTIGLFIEMFPLAVELEECETFAQLLRRVQGETNGFIRHARPGLSEGSGRAFNVVLNYLTVSFPPFDGHPVEVGWIHPGHCDHNHHLRIQVHDFRGTGAYSVIFDFNDAVFRDEQRAWVTTHFTHLLDAFLADRDQAIDAVEVVHPDERALLLEDFSQPPAEAPTPGTTICDAFDRIATHQPDAPAVSDGDGHLTYRELADRADALAGRLHALGVGGGAVVGLRATRDVDTVAGLLGILRAGAAYLPLSPDHPASRTSLVLEEAGVQVVVGRGDLEGWDGPRLDPRESDASAPPPPDGPDPSDLAYVLYTSGSTGRPKGVQIEHRNVLTLVAGLRERVYATEGDRLRVAMVAPFFFDPSVQQIFAALLLGHELVMVPEDVRIDGDALLRFFHQRQIDLSDGTPQHLALLAKASGEEHADVRARHFVIGGEELRPSILRAFYERFPAGDPVVTNVYGPTECCVDSTSERITRDDLPDLGETVPIGKPMPGERIHILNGGTLQPLGAPGELCIAGPAVGRGYQRAPEGSPDPFGADPFREGDRLYRSGDLARYRRDGRIEFLGRRDTQVKVRGFRIELGEIENALKSFDAPLRPKMEAGDGARATRRCVRCVLSEHYPGVTFDATGLCNHCREFERYRPAANEYFRPFRELEELLAQSRDNGSEYDCLLLYSGGKDSSYVLHRLVEMGLKVLAYTFDNGFISPGAFRNIERQTSRLGVECIISKTPRMDAIFVESLDQDQTVCTGCFKALTTISTRLAADRGIRTVLTGLSRGQIYETKIEGLFRSGTTAVQQVEDKLRTFRRIYHSQQDRTSLLLDVAVDDVELDRFHFIDFFRYDATPTTEVKAYLAERDEFWSTPEDTGFCSSNCMMNDIGICVHSSERGYHNYEAPLSWDIRLGIAGREDALGEVESPVDIDRVNRVLGKIGYLSRRIDDAVVTVRRSGSEGDASLCAYYTSSHDLDPGELRSHLAVQLPSYMVPQHFVEVPAIPLTPNGKVDYRALPDPGEASTEEEPANSDNPVESRLVEIWRDVLQVGSVGIHDSFVSLGGTSLALIEMRIRLTSEFGVELPLPVLFSHPTVAQLAEAVVEAQAGVSA